MLSESGRELSQRGWIVTGVEYAVRMRGLVVMEYAVRKQNGNESEGVGYGEIYAARKSGRQTGLAVYMLPENRKTEWAEGTR